MTRRVPRLYPWHFGVSLFPLNHSPGVSNTLGGSALTLATRSGAVPRIDIYSPGVDNTLGGFVSIRPVLATRSGATPYAVNLSSLLHHRRCSVCYVDFSSTCFGSSMTSPAASVRQQHRLQQAFDNIITMIQPPCDSTNHDMQELHLVLLHATYMTTTSRRISD
jgi:hypothetical protein